MPYGARTTGTEFNAQVAEEGIFCFHNTRFHHYLTGWNVQFINQFAEFLNHAAVVGYDQRIGGRID